MKQLLTRWGWIGWLLLCSLSVHAQLLAVIDKSRAEDAGLSQAKLNLISQAVRGELRRNMPANIQILTEESTVAILRDMGVDLKDCTGDCEVEVARKLNADWLVSVTLVKLGNARTVQLNLFETATGALLLSELGSALDETALMTVALERAGLLGLGVAPRTTTGGTGRFGEQPDEWQAGSQLGVVIRFVSVPEGATVSLDGSYLGETPLSREIQPGPHSIEWALARYETLAERVTIKDKTTLEQKLVPQFGWLSVESTPTGHPVLLDGVPQGKTPLKEFLTGHGTHTILVGDNVLAYPQGERFILDKGEHKTLNYTIPLREGALVVRCTDSKGNVLEVPVLVNGKAVGTSPLQLKLPIGEHEVQAGDVRQKVRLFEKTVETTTLTVTPTENSHSGQRVMGGLHGMTFVNIPSGTYSIGSPRSEGRRGGNETQHMVTLDAFAMMITEVTQTQWQEVMGSNPSRFKGGSLPVENVSWRDVQDFLSKLNRLHPGNNFRLPTEAEWEVACRAGTAGPYSSGNSEEQLSEIAWYSANSGSQTHPVAQKRPNAWGLYDMHGNVWEWCQDWYGSYANGTQRNPQGSRSGTDRVNRGGCWSNGASLLRCASRGSSETLSTRSTLGFRLAKTP